MKSRILVVDDSPTIQNLLRMVLRQNGYEVATASDGVEGLKKMEGQDVDLVISDLNMPRMDGITFIKKIRESKTTPLIPVILLSTEQDQRDIDKAIRSGASRYLVKPVQPAVLIAEIKKLLN